MAEERLYGDPEVIHYGNLRLMPVATLPTWTSAEEGRLVYTLDTDKLYYGDDSGWVELGSSPKIKHHYGTGLDGDVDINSGSFSSGPITNNVLTRDAHFDNLTLSGGNLDTADFRLFVRGTLTMEDTYHVQCPAGHGGNGNNGSGTTGGNGGTYGAGTGGITGGTLPLSPPGFVGKKGGNGGAGGGGSNGVTGDGGAGLDPSIGVDGSDGSAGGDGGNPNKGLGASGGPGGVVTALPAYAAGVTDLVHLTLWRALLVSSNEGFYGNGGSAGSGSGGGGGATPVALGGGGGGSGGSGGCGGNMYVAAYEIIDNNASGDGIRAPGGNGGNGGNGADGINPGGPGMAGGGGGGAGGAGGGGGIVVIVTHSLVAYTIALCCPGGTGGTKGTGGAGANGGAAGSDGADGLDGPDGLLFLFCQES